MEQTGVRIFLASMLCGVLYVFGSLAVLVLTARTYCEHRPAILAFAVVGFLLLALTAAGARYQNSGSKVMFVLPATFFLLGTGIPTWLFVHALRVCAVQAGR